MMRRTVLTLSAIAFTLVAMSGYAKAPSFKALPDVIISDQEKNGPVPFTTDFNFFVYMEAFDILTYAQDEDSTPNTDLKFVFLEENDYDDLRINNVPQLDIGAYDEADPSTWPAGSLIIPDGQGDIGDFMVSFRDYVRSPGEEGNEGPFPNPIYDTASGTEVTSGMVPTYLPWHDAAGNLVRTSDPSGDKPFRTIEIWAGDQDNNPGSGTLNVYSVNGLGDDLSGLFTTIFTDNGMTEADWISEGIGGITLATATASGGELNVTANGIVSYARWRLRTYQELAVKPVVDGVDPGNVFYNWAVIDYVPDDNVVYSGRFSIQHDQASRDTVPTMRLGFNDVFSYQQALNYQGTVPESAVINLPVSPAIDADLVNTGWPEQNTTRVFRQYWANNPGADEATLNAGNVAGIGGDHRNFNVSFDLLNIHDTGAGSLTMNGFEVGVMPRPEEGTVVANVVDEDFVLVNAGTDSNGGATVTPNAANHTIAITCPGSTTTVPWIQCYNVDAIKIQPDTLIRLRVELSCPTTADLQNFKAVRVKVTDTRLSTATTIYYINNQPFDNLFGYPGLPPAQDVDAGATAFYDVYFPVTVTDVSEIERVAASHALYTGTDYYSTSIDYIGDFHTANPSTVTVHSVTQEVLALPAM